MKNTIFALVLAVTFLGACSMPDVGSGGETGAVGMRLALATRAGGEAPTSVRVWVYSDNVLLASAGGTDYYEASLSAGAGSVIISDLPPGEGYRLVVAAGIAAGTAGSRFRTLRYGMSPNFTVKSGVETGVSMTLADIETDYEEISGGFKSLVVANGTNIYTVTSSAVYQALSVNAFEGNGGIAWSTGDRGNINSISLGYDLVGDTQFPLVNTTNGVYKATTPAAPERRGDVLASPGALQSGAYDDVFFFQGEGQLGGLSGGKAEWTKIDLDIDGLTGKPVMDFFVEKDTIGAIYGFFATKFVGAFRMGEDFITEGNPDIADILGKDEKLTFFGEKLPLIQAFGYTADASKTLYLGTKNGAYRTDATLASGSILSAAEPTLVAGTRGIDIRKIVTTLKEGVPVIAMISAKELILVKNALVYRMPYVNGLVGDLTDIAWQGEKIILTGTAGIGEVDTSKI